MVKGEKIVFGIMILMSIFLVVFFNMDITGHKMKFKEDKITIDGEAVKVEDIESVKLLEDVHIGNKINGTNTFTYTRAICQVDGDKKASVYVYNNSKPYIKIISKDKMVIYNDKESSETVKTYNNLINKYNIKESSKVSEEKFSYEPKDKLIVYMSILPVTIIFIGLGVYALKRKTPMHFWAGSTVSSEEISDIKGYNKANGIMWICYGLSFLLIPILGESIGDITLAILVPIMVVALMLTYKVIYNKYKVK
jgi:maltodextrin utilization protein YvdJ